jgi:hypothetical protein
LNACSASEKLLLYRGTSYRILQHQLSVAVDALSQMARVSPPQTVPIADMLADPDDRLAAIRLASIDTAQQLVGWRAVHSLSDQMSTPLALGIR